MNLQCIYLDVINGVCHASPPNVPYYKPNEKTQQDFCKNPTGMEGCPRLHQYEDYLKALGRKSVKKK